MIATFGNFTRGDLAEFSDKSCGGAGSLNCTTISPNTEVRPSGDYKARIKTNAANANCHCYGQAQWVRVHLLGFPAANPKPATTPGATVWWAWSIRRISAGTHSVVLQEWHQPNGQATCSKLQGIPAPFNFQTRWAGGRASWNFICRGSTDCTNGGFISWCWGDPASFSPQTPPSRVVKPWDAGDAHYNTGELWHFLAGWHFAQDMNGWFEAWACKHGQPMQNVVKRTPNPTTYPFPNYPIVSQYYDSSQGGDCEYEHMFGAIGDNVDELRGWQEGRVGYDIWAGGTPPPPPPPDPVQTTTSSIHEGDTLPYGSVDWIVTATPGVAAVEFYFDGPKVATVQGPGTQFAHKLDTTKLTAGDHNCGWRLMDAAGNGIRWGTPEAMNIKVAAAPTPDTSDVVVKAAEDAWTTKQALQAEIKRLQAQKMTWPQIQRNLGSVRAVPTGQTTLSWKIWQTVEDVKDPSPTS